MSELSWEECWAQAQAAVQEGRLEEALEHLYDASRLCTAFDDDDLRVIETLTLLGAIFARLGRTEECRAVLARVLGMRLKVAEVADYPVASALFVLGEALRQADQPVEAGYALTVGREILLRLSVEDELRTDVEVSLALVMGQLGQATECLQHVQEALHRLPAGSARCKPLLYLTAQQGVYLGDYGFAGRVYEKLARLLPAGPEAGLAAGNWADMLLMENRFAEALQALELCEEKAGADEPSLWRRRAIALARLQRVGEALVALEQGIQKCWIAGDRADLLHLRGQLLLRSGEKKQALVVLQEALLLARGDLILRGSIRISLGRLWLATRSWKRARAPLAAAAALGKKLPRPPVPLVAEALNLLGNVHRRGGHLRRAQSRYSAALAFLESDPTPASALHPPERQKRIRITSRLLADMSRALEGMGRFAEAAGVLDPALQVRPNPSRRSLERLASLFQRAGKVAEESALRVYLASRG